MPNVTISTNAQLGNFCLLNGFASVGHDTIIGDGCTLSGHAEINGRVRLGRGVFLGSHATVLPDAIVNDFAIVGAGSVVLKSVEAYTTVVGVPAVAIFKRNRI